MPRSTEKQRTYRKQYYQTHKEQEKARKQTAKYKAQQKEYMQQKRRRLKKQLDEIFGKKCYLCDSTRKPITGNNYVLEMHEIYNHKHTYGGTGSKQYYIDHKEDFVRLCSRCHYLVTWLNNRFGKTWKEIMTFINV